MTSLLRPIQLVLSAIAIGLGLGAAFLWWQSAMRNPQNLSLEELGQTAGEAYVFAYPLLVMDQTRSNMLGIADSERGPGFYLNQLTHIRDLPSYGDEAVVRPNLDTLYSIAWLDLSEGPVELRWPDMGDRYWLFQVLDGWTDVAGAPGTRTLGSQAGSAMITGPGWSGVVPPGMIQIRVETEMAWVLGRIEVSALEADQAAVHALQDQFSLTGPEISEFPATKPVRLSRPADVIETLAADDVMARFARLMRANPPRPDDAEMVDRLAALGFDPRGFRLPGGSLAELAMGRGVDVARERLTEGIANRPYGPTNWRTLREGVGDYGDDYALRAGVAMIGLGANLPEDAIYPTTSVDSEGRPLHGDHVYRLRFAPGQLPPADAFWSVTAYDADGFLMDTPWPVFSDRSNFVVDADGSVSLNIGPPTFYEVPTNHLSVSPEAFQLTARLYLPREAALSGEWEMPTVERLR